MKATHLRPPASRWGLLHTCSRTRRGATGGSFVNRITWSEAHEQLVTTATLLMTVAPVSPDAVAEARLTLLTACVPLAAERRQQKHLAKKYATRATQKGLLKSLRFALQQLEK